MPIHMPVAAALLLAAAGAASAAEPVRIEPTVYPMLETPAAKRGDRPAGKPEPAQRVPGPLLTTHAHRAADGSISLSCEQDHAAPTAALQQEGQP